MDNSTFVRILHE
jgi:hypothetical protein